MLNCGMYQNDIAELKADEVNWKQGTLTRARSKTRERNGPVVTYKLWPETFALLKKHRAEGELALTTDEGNPLVKYWLEDGKTAPLRLDPIGMDAAGGKDGRKNPPGHEAPAEDLGVTPRPAPAVQVLCESLPGRLTQEHRRPALRHPQ